MIYIDSLVLVRYSLKYNLRYRLSKMARTKRGREFSIEELTNNIYFDASPGKSKQKQPRFKKVPLPNYIRVPSASKQKESAPEPTPKVSSAPYIVDEDIGNPPVKGKVGIT